jgi:hypothetical protein
VTAAIINGRRSAGTCLHPFRKQYYLAASDAFSSQIHSTKSFLVVRIFASIECNFLVSASGRGIYYIYFIALPSTSIQTSIKNNTVNKLARMSKTCFCRVRSHFKVLANVEWLAAGKWFRLPSLHDFDVRVCVCLLILAALI